MKTFQEDNGLYMLYLQHGDQERSQFDTNLSSRFVVRSSSHQTAANGQELLFLTEDCLLEEVIDFIGENGSFRVENHVVVESIEADRQMLPRLCRDWIVALLGNLGAHVQEG